MNFIEFVFIEFVVMPFDELNIISICPCIKRIFFNSFDTWAYRYYIQFIKIEGMTTNSMKLICLQNGESMPMNN